jgi:hypothetical protein
MQTLSGVFYFFGTNQRAENRADNPRNVFKLKNLLRFSK